VLALVIVKLNLACQFGIAYSGLTNIRGASAIEKWTKEGEIYGFNG
jgi:hypothetical protein